MPLNAETYLEHHGWRGKGVPLDGERGRGLKKPLALPMKRNLKGLGKERDRATEWWDSLFEASAKKMGSGKGTVANGQTTTSPSIEDEAAGRETSKGISLIALAKREHARKSLMNNFVRGKPDEYGKEKLQQLEDALRLQSVASAECNKEDKATDKSKLEVVPSITSELRVKRVKSDQHASNSSASKASAAAAKATSKAEKAERKRRKEEKRARKARKAIKAIKEIKVQAQEAPSDSPDPVLVGDTKKRKKGGTTSLTDSDRKRKMDDSAILQSTSKRRKSKETKVLSASS